MKIFEVPEQYATLQEALVAAAAEKGDRTVRVTGEQTLSAPVVIDNTIQPEGTGNLILEGGENAVINGALTLTGFTYQGEYAGGDMFTLTLPEGVATRHLYADGKPMPRPSTPEYRSSGWAGLEREDYRFGDPIGKFMLNEEEKTEYSTILTSHREMLTRKNPTDIEMIFETGWTHCVIPVTGVEETEDGWVRIIPKADAFRQCHTRNFVPIGSCPNRFENVFEEIKPGEFYLDRTEHTLYLLLKKGDKPENHRIELPLTEKLLTVSGTPENKIGSVTFRNLTFRGTTYMAPARIGHPETQANIIQFPDVMSKYNQKKYIKTASAVSVSAARGICFEACRFTCLGSGALDFEAGTEDCSVSRCEIFGIAGSAVQIGDFDLSAAHPENPAEIVRAITVKNCHIHDTGLEYAGSVAIVAGYTQDLAILHNHIHHVPYSGVSVGWGWAWADMTITEQISAKGQTDVPVWTEPSVCKRNRVDYNHIHHAMQRLHDGGAIYTLGTMDGSTVIGNCLHDSAGYEGDGYPAMHVGGVDVPENKEAAPFTQNHGFPGGLYMDEGSAGIEVRDNIFYHITTPIFYHNRIHEGYKKIALGKNYFNLKPEDKDFPAAIAARAGEE